MHPDSNHQDKPLETAGASPENATAAMVLLHGRGSTAQEILQMTEQFAAENVAYLAPQAAGNTWYPNPFTAPVESNEPVRTSGLQAVDDAISVAEVADIPNDRVVILGFSQGGCLASEFVARNPDRYGGLVALSGGLIGESIDPDEYAGDLNGTTVFLGCSDTDPHIPAERVNESATVFERLGGDVTTRLYEGMGHGINGDEIQFVSELLTALVE